MAKATLETFEQAHSSHSLRQRVPAVQEIAPRVAFDLWQTTLAKHQAWPKEQIFLAALGIALQLSRNPAEQTMNTTTHAKSRATQAAKGENGITQEKQG